jgi:hypothetical protein
LGDVNHGRTHPAQAKVNSTRVGSIHSGCSTPGLAPGRFDIPFGGRFLRNRGPPDSQAMPALSCICSRGISPHRYMDRCFIWHRCSASGRARTFRIHRQGLTEPVIGSSGYRVLMLAFRRFQCSQHPFLRLLMPVDPRFGPNIHIRKLPSLGGQSSGVDGPVFPVIAFR